MMPIDRSTPLWIASRILIAERKSDLLRNWKQTLKTFDPEDIHDLRVSTRRISEALALFSPCFHPKTIVLTSKEIRRLTRILGAMRNTDEALSFFLSLDTASPGGHSGAMETISRQLEMERCRERDILEKKLQRISLATVRQELELVLKNPLIFGNSSIDPFIQIDVYCRDRIADRAGTVNELVEPSLQEANVNAQHRLRIAVKRLRYRYEIMFALCCDDYSHLHSTVKSYQDLLGEMHDMDVFAQIAGERITEPLHRFPILDEIARRRHELFCRFSELMEINPLDTLGERMQRSL